MNAKLYSVAALAIVVGWMMTSVAGPAMADTKNSDQAQATATKDTPVAQQAYLGVEIEPLHPGVASHLPGVLIPGQGVLVNSVTANSPAATAGIMQHDILVRYGDQKLFSAEQLAKLVMADQPGRAVDIALVRGGKLQSVHATLGSHAVSETAPSQASHPWWREFTLPWFSQHHAVQPRSMQPTTVPSKTANADPSRDWDSFDSLTLRRLDNGKFQAEINYLDDHGKVEHHAFTGTRDEIEKAVTAEKDLPANERGHLLNAIEHPRQAMTPPEFRFDRAGDFDSYWQRLPSEF